MSALIDLSLDLDQVLDPAFSLSQDQDQHQTSDPDLDQVSVLDQAWDLNQSLAQALDSAAHIGVLFLICVSSSYLNETKEIQKRGDTNSNMQQNCLNMLTNDLNWS